MAGMSVHSFPEQDVVTLADLRALTAASGPCLTLVMPIPQPLELAARLKNGIRAMEKQLGEMRMAEAEAQELLAPVRQLAIAAEAGHRWAHALAALRAPGVFRHFWLRERLPETAAAGERFEIRSLLAALARDQRFHVLALSRSRVRLFGMTPHGVEERPLETVAPPETDLDARASEKMGEKDRDDDRRLLKDVERRVTAALEPDSGPLILAAVEHEAALYRRLNRYPHLLEEAIHGSPDGSTAQALHERGWEIVSRRRGEALEKALAEYRKHEGTTRVSRHAATVLREAAEGRVAGLFLTAQTGGGLPDDPMNRAACDTVRQGGWAFTLPAEDMPAPGPAAALLRF